MFACGYLLQDGSQCLHVSRRKALACVERGKLVDYANRCNKDQFAARSEAAIAVKNEIATRDLVTIAEAKGVKLEAEKQAWETLKVEATEALKRQNARVLELESALAIAEARVLDLEAGAAAFNAVRVTDSVPLEPVNA